MQLSIRILLVLKGFIRLLLPYKGKIPTFTRIIERNLQNIRLYLKRQISILKQFVNNKSGKYSIN